MVLERLFLKKLLDKNKFKLLNRIYTLFVVLISWVLFRTTSLDGAFEFIKIMFIQNINVLPNNAVYLSDLLTKSNIIILISSIFLSGLIPGILRKLKKIKEGYEVFLEPIVLILLFLICIMYIVNGTYTSFIYMNF